MEIDELEVVCKKVRQGLENARAYKPMGCFDLLKSFPNGCCKITAFIVMYCLTEYMGLPKREFVLLANAQIGKASHAWARYGNINIDLTADQFVKLNRPKVIVSSENPWPGVDYSVFPYQKVGMYLRIYQV